MVAASRKNATKMLEALDELVERNGHQGVAILHREAETDRGGLERHLAVAERFRALDTVTGDPNLPEVLVHVAADVLEVIIFHVIVVLWLCNSI